MADGQAEVSFKLLPYGERKYNGQRWTPPYYLAADSVWLRKAQHSPSLPLHWNLFLLSALYHCL
ncbi:hypothetical protein F7725_012981 [Dissostichus mawsoni]|uniref:Uncharacterized protein n=1 Tax=Dissostichus mawsoni TaxID=36200 RepID=A0A7J5YR80_DISMA|nr:hypothetical protein F7725_012981 [Dissostichus mawsoni]